MENKKLWTRNMECSFVVCHRSFREGNETYVNLLNMLNQFIYEQYSINTCFLIFLMFLFIFDRERAQAGEGERDRDTQNLKQAPGSELSAQSSMRGSNPQTARS